MVVNKERNKAPALLAHTHQYLKNQGIGVYEVPSGLGFEFNIWMENQPPEHYFTVEITRGDGEKVIINKGNTIYYPCGYVLEIDNMETGSTRSFEQYVPSQKEKDNSNNNAGVDKENPTGNWKFSFTLYTKFEKPRERHEWMDGIDLGNTRGNSNARGYNQGITKEGGNYSSHIDTVSCSDTIWTPCGKKSMTVQLVSSESQETLDMVKDKPRLWPFGWNPLANLLLVGNL